MIKTNSIKTSFIGSQGNRLKRLLSVARAIDWMRDWNYLQENLKHLLFLVIVLPALKISSPPIEVVDF